MTQQHTPPIATAEQRQALRRNQTQRLRNLGEQLLRAVEDLDPPKTHKDAETAGKTLLVLDRVLDAIYDIKPDDDRTVPYSRQPAEPETEYHNLTTWQSILDASLDALAQARALNRGDA
ncbi:MAG: hypothetical protein WDN06_10235 [Asticcacaulis sp.]